MYRHLARIQVDDHAIVDVLMQGRLLMWLFEYFENSNSLFVDGNAVVRGRDAA